ncbi:MAG: DNA-processing protein DprA [Bacteroides sp.]|nr:DNA-processing protein DprA [Bacteroides sp.]
MEKEYAYWMALAHTEKMRIARKNDFVIRCYEKGIKLSDFFHGSVQLWKEAFEMSDEEIEWINVAKAELPNYAFLAEDLLEQGYDLIPIMSPDYPQSIKVNLKKTYSPPLIYIKGNKLLLQEESVAIVGSRQAGEISLQFTDNVAKRAVSENKVVISGYAKGVDKQALDSALKYSGKSIIILPQGITTFTSGYKALYKDIIKGNVLVVSTFHPKAPWNTGLAMARNVYIYGMATEIYVAESDSKGGTWAGAIDGLRKKRKIYVRKPESEEKNANQLLIEKGANPVSLQGERYLWEEAVICVNEPTVPYGNIDDRIRAILKQQKLCSKEIIKRLSLDWSVRKMTEYLKQMTDIEVINRSPKVFTMKGFNSEPMLF